MLQDTGLSLFFLFGKVTNDVGPVLRDGGKSIDLLLQLEAWVCVDLLLLLRSLALSLEVVHLLLLQSKLSH